MGKNNIRKKTGNQIALRITDNPNIIGIPADMYMMEAVCVKCGKGVMRPSGRTLVAPDGKGQAMIHRCTHPDCEETMTDPIPWPRPDFVPKLDATNQQVGEQIGKLREMHIARIEAEKEERREGDA